MIIFFKNQDASYFAVRTKKLPALVHQQILSWLFSNAIPEELNLIKGKFIGPRMEMVTPFSTNAVEIAINCGISTIDRIELFYPDDGNHGFDPMLQRKYHQLDQHLFTLHDSPQDILQVSDISDYNQKEGLALSVEEINFLNKVSDEIGRPLTDSEVFGFSQVNSEHCRHKIFNGRFIINGVEQPETLFKMIRKTSEKNPNFLISAYTDNVAFISGPVAEQFAPPRQDRPDYFKTKDYDAVISLKAETHNFPTTVEPFNGAATGSGGEIRDRMAGGQGSIPLAGTAVYMTSYPRISDRNWEGNIQERPWLYQTPGDILIKASNGASDYGNKFGQPLICGSILTFEHEEDNKIYGFDKVIMLAGGIGFAKLKGAKKKQVATGNDIVVLGGDNYRIGMGGGAVSSVDTGELDNAIELNAVQRSNPEMQKRVANVVRAMVELDENPVTAIHDHGAGGHLNCLSELVEEKGGKIEIEKLPIGDPTLSDKEIMSNESQERMGLVISQEDTHYLLDVSDRERSPMYKVGTVGSDMELKFVNKHGERPFNLHLDHLFGSSPKTILRDITTTTIFQEPTLKESNFETYLTDVLQLESVASKDWLTNKVDRCVTGKVALQQTTGELQLPLNNLGIMTIDYKHRHGVATSIGHAPVAGLSNPSAASRLAVAESLTNIVFAPLKHGLKGISLSANWMWPAKNKGENARLYAAVKAISEFAIELGINIPTGKDSLSMVQKYPDGTKVHAPGTVIVTACAEVSNVSRAVTPELKNEYGSELIYIPFGKNFNLGGSALYQTQNAIGNNTPDVDAESVKTAFLAVQKLLDEGFILAGHDIGAGGLITTLLEMNFPNISNGLELNLKINAPSILSLLFSESPAVVLQVKKGATTKLQDDRIRFHPIGRLFTDRTLTLQQWKLDIDHYRDIWMKSSFEMDKRQTDRKNAEKRFGNYKHQPLRFSFPKAFTGKMEDLGLDPNRKIPSRIKAAVIREKGVNSDREMAYALHLSGFDVKDVHMTDLVTGREDLKDIQFMVFAGGFSNSDVLGSGKGWAGSFLFNKKAKKVLDDFYARPNTLSLGVCNGCQVMMELEVISQGHPNHPKMHPNSSGKFECRFTDVTVPKNNTVLLHNMEGTRLGIWAAHGEGRFKLDSGIGFQIALKYAYDAFPANLNGSDLAAAAISSEDGRHMAMMPHLERSLFPHNWAYYIHNKTAHEVTPWMLPFVNAFKWCKQK